MLGNAIYRFFSQFDDSVVFGTVRSISSKQALPSSLHSRLVDGVDVENYDSLIKCFEYAKPDVVINCVGLVKQLTNAEDVLTAIPINTLLPHRLAKLCGFSKSRLIHISTDCVFSGKQGLYTETDFADAQDVYGRSKYLGELNTYSSAITLRTSIIGHELNGNRSLINWFLSQSHSVKGFTNAIFSGLPTVELATIIRDYVIPAPDLFGLYHVSSNPISKYNLLDMVSRVYGKEINIIPDPSFVIDRSLDCSKFSNATGYKPRDWFHLIEIMKDFG